MSEVTNIKRTAKTARPDDLSGVYLKPGHRRGTGIFGAEINSLTTPWFVKAMGYLVLTLALTFSVGVGISYISGVGGGTLPVINGSIFIVALVIFVMGEFLSRSEFPQRGLSMLLLWGTVGLIFLIEMIDALMFCDSDLPKGDREAQRKRLRTQERTESLKF
ncbi:hypothetical protein OAF06_03565 [Akkermansiaceae bacterium]|nr:hypothetical protein [Akkermansiaceae bacterium]MDB4667834.1 hypothetical protein [Akkermansiaceae bacterium]